MTTEADPKAATRAIATRSTQLSFTIREEMALTTVAEVFLRSGLFPDVKAAQQAMVKILAGREMGMEPVQAMMSLQIVEGRITMTAEAMAARVASSPVHRYRVKEMDDEACEIVFQERAAEGWETIGVSRFTIQDAEHAGLCRIVDGQVQARSAKGYKLPWEAHTRNLLFARAMSNGFRWFTPHLKLPSLATSEEVEALQAVTVQNNGPSQGAADLEAALAESSDRQAAAVDAEFVEESPTAKRDEPQSEARPPVADLLPEQQKLFDTGREAATLPGQPLGLREFQRLAAAYKAHLGEEVYHGILKPFGGKSNAVPPAMYAAALAALHGGCEMPGGPAFPSPESFRDAQGLDKGELLEGIPFLEGRCSVGQSLRQTYLGEESQQLALVAPLRVYYAVLLDMLAELQAQA